MKKHLFICFAICLLVCSSRVQAQVGVNTTNPDPSAALDITSPTKGLLIPRIDEAARLGMTDMANSLLVYDTTKKLYYYYQANDGKWYALNAWQSEVIENGGNTDTITTTFSNVGIGTATPAKRLDVVGDIAASKTITAGESITAPKIYGEGAMPVGSIIMWSGDPAALPVGWALCDGANGTPDLKGRFIVGYDPADPDYNATQKVGPAFADADGTSTGANSTDAKQVRLTGAQSGVAPHSHTATQTPHNHGFNDVFQQDKTVGKNAGGGEDAASNFEDTRYNTTDVQQPAVTVQDAVASSAVQPIENRPPYYVLAYIIKLAY